MRRPIYESMHLLMQRAHDQLTPADWFQLTDLADAAASEALRLAKVTEHIGCMVSDDGESAARSGFFQNSEDVFALLCSLSHSLEMIGAMAEVGSYAASQLIPIPQPEVRP